jgi:glycosyltransferase involved in cell wall biosynthesis
MCGAAHDLIEPGFNGFIVEAGSVEQLAAAMAVYADDPERALRHGHRSRVLSAHFTPERVANTFLETVAVWRGAGTRRPQRIASEMRVADLAGGD